jgi:hypothetical protein
MRGLIDRLVAVLAMPVVPGARTRMGDLVLIAWFAAITAFNIGESVINWAFGWDGLIYTHAAQALLAGRNPWAPDGVLGQFAGPPPSLIPFLPFVWLPDPIVAAGSVALAAASAVYVVRRLHLPAWWLLFPPVSVGILAGSAALTVTALLVFGGAIAEGAAIAARLYAAVPLAVLGRWRGFAVAAAIVAVTAPFLDWPQYLRDFGSINEALTAQAKGGQSALAVPWLIPIAIVCLALLGRRRAAWLLVPALWPATQGYYGVIALPVIAEVPLVAIAMALNNVPIIVPGFIVTGLVAQVVVERLRPPARPAEARTVGSPA